MSGCLQAILVDYFMRMTNLETSSGRNSGNGHSLVENGDAGMCVIQRGTAEDDKRHG